MAAMNANHQCANCLRPFVQSNSPVSANPRARSVIDSAFCNRCDAERIDRLLDCQPAKSFTELLREKFAIGEPS